MTDPMVALRYLQIALDSKELHLQPCALHPEIGLHVDHPDGKARFTYALMVAKKVQAVALFAHAEPIDGLPCFNIGYAVLEELRGNGLASKILTQAIDELQNGLARTPIKTFYIEAIVSTRNEPSNAIATKVVSTTRVAGTDAFSGEEIYQYTRKINAMPNLSFQQTASSAR